MDILICGVGGQGVLLLSDVLSDVARRAGLDIKKSEVHGMSQRGGSVTSHVRFAARVYSPLIEVGHADILVAMEKLEGLRYVHFLAPTGRALVDPLEVMPAPVLAGTAPYPDDIETRLRAAASRLTFVPAAATARALGNPRTQNVVMLGALARFLEFEPAVYVESLRELVPARHIELNLKAFAAGRALTAEPGPT